MTTQNALKTNCTSIKILKNSWLYFLLFLSFAFQAGTLHAQFNFSPSSLKGVVLSNPTSLQFGPDGRLYVAQQNGIIMAFTIKRNAANDYIVTATETIAIINLIPNHDDNGVLNPGVTTRQVTGILVKGTAAQPIIYVTSSDSRVGGGGGGDLNLDTNSGIISLLTKSGGVWQKLDLVRGLPRSEENHSNNGMQMNDATNKLYVAVGGLTNAGSPSVNFAYACEYALSAAILSIDLNVINALPIKGTGNNSYKYDLPTLDDPTRSNNPDGSDVNDPFGGNNGLNQAKLVKNGPVQIFASGFRNSYDLLITKTPGKAGRMYTIDNGANEGWGGYPENEGTNNVTNNYMVGEPGSTGQGAGHPIVNNLDNFHYIGDLATYVPGSFYGGHPNPVRANPAGAGLFTFQDDAGVFRTSKTGANPLPADWPPVPVDMAHPVEGTFLMPGVQDNAPLTFGTSTNGLAEYTASNFNNELKGNILALGFNDGSVFRIRPTDDGTDVLNSRRIDNRLNQDVAFASGFGSQPLDIVAQGDSDIYPGTVWVATYGDHAITIFEPQDFVNCTGKYDANDDDKDGYTNADEMDNHTNPCSSASKPADFDHDFISDLNDPDDDNDGIPDNIDLFPLDASNGLTTHLPIKYNLYNNDPGTGFFGLGFTGLMSNKTPNNDYLHLFSVDSMIAGGAVGAFTLTAVSSGDAFGKLNNQDNAFQFGVSPNAGSGPFTVNTRMLGPFFSGKAPVNYQSQGMFIGTGDQSNYFKITLSANGGTGGIEVVYEKNDTPVVYQFPLPGGIPSFPTSTLDLYLDVNPVAATIQPKYSVNGGTIMNLGSPIAVSGQLLNAIQGSPALAVGIISTSRGAQTFNASWDYLYVTYDPVTSAGTWQTITPNSGLPITREENAFVEAGDKFYLMGGRGVSPVQAYDPINKTWTDKMQPPMELNHFQAVTLGGLVYAPAAFTGNFPHETPVPKIYMYNPTSDKWLDGATIPAARRRGSAGAVTYKNKIYLVCGITDGHYAGWVKWFDEYDPLTNTWKVLPDAPRPRDHFHAVVINDKLYVTAGRLSSDSTGQVWSLNTPEVDVYDFISGQWSTLPAASNIPTPRAGAGTTVLGNDIIVIGGESDQLTANIEVEALNVQTNVWRRLSDLQQRRHGTQVIKSNNGLYISAGAGLQGGGGFLTSTESFYLFNPTVPNGTPLLQSQLTATLDSAFNYVPMNSESNRNLTLSNTGGTQDIVLSSIAFSGAASFSGNIPYTLPFVIPAGKTLVLNIKFKPTTPGSQSASLLINHSGIGDSLRVPLNGDVSIPYYRVNAGGDKLTTFIGNFSADTLYSPSPGDVFSTTSLVSGTSDPALYQTERNSSVDTFGYAFPVPNGNYSVTLHFAELYYTGAGLRIFDVSMEGSKVLDNYDIVRKVGFLAATTETFPVTVNDGVLNINFSSLAADGGSNRPKVNAIEVLGLPNSKMPVANAGPDVVVQLPSNSVTLSGSGSSNIRTYSWTQVSGPGTAVFSSASGASPAVSQLVAGSYVFSLVVTDVSGFVSPADQVIVTVNNLLPASGLNYRYYEGTWNALPNFNLLSPVKTGTSPNIDLTVRNRPDSFGIVWEGNIYIPTAGSYTFETVSDEGSKLYFNSLYAPGATALVNNDSLHLARSASGTVSVPIAGLYPIAISYFDKTGADSMKVYWSGPGIARQLIPNIYFGTKLQIDTTAPSIPANLKVNYSGRTFVNLDWDNATDSVGIVAYDIYVNGVKKYVSIESAITADSLLPATSYTFSVKARDLAGNTSAASTIITSATTNTTNGLNYRYYEGTWNLLPNFNALTPVKTGLSQNVDLTVRNRPDSFGIVWEGYVNIPTAGTYTFETLSDEGSKLYFNSFYSPSATALVNNDSLHLARLASGTVAVGTAGLYPIAISYFDKTGADSMKVYWTGPGITRQLIPNSAFTNVVAAPLDTTAPSIPLNVKTISVSQNMVSLHWDAATDNVGVVAYDVYRDGVKKYTTTATDLIADTLVASTSYSFTAKARDLAGNTSGASAAASATTISSSTANGLSYRYYEGNWNALPNVNTLTPIKSGVSPNIDLTVRNRPDSFGIVWEGFINIPAAGSYTFETFSDEGSKLYFNSLYAPGATALVNNDSLHLARSASGTVSVSAAGLYPIAISYFDKTGVDTMKVYWSGPGFGRQLISNTAFTTGTPQFNDTIAPAAPANLRLVSVSQNLVTLHWDVATDNIGVVAYDVYRDGVKKYTTSTANVDFVADSLAANTTYSFTVKARDLAGNSSASGTAISATTITSTVTNGLNYRYYEGVWNVLPNFNALTPVKTGVSSNIDLTVRNKTDSFGIVWEGFINIPTTGTYTFETLSDEGSKLYFNSFYAPAATALVNNDSLHLAKSALGTVTVSTVGLYPIAISYFDKSGADTMKVYWTGPGIPRQLIPTSALTYVFIPPADTTAPSVPANVKLISVSQNMVNLHWNASTDNVGVVAYDVYRDGVKKYTTTATDIIADTLVASTSYSFTVKARDLAGNTSAASAAAAATTISSSTANGLNYRYYEGTWSVLPNFNTLVPVKTGVSPNVDLTVRNKLDSSGIVWEGFINIQTAGAFTFETVSDEGSKLYFNSLYAPNATPLVNNDSLHLAKSATGTVTVSTVGLYPIAISYFDKSGADSMKVYWSGPGFSRQLIPNAAFTAAGIPAADTSAPAAPTNLVAGTTTATSIALSWNASTDNVGVVGYDIYVGGVKKYTSTTTSVLADTLVANTAYSFTVKARDLAGNSSAASTPLSATTTAAAPAVAGLNYKFYQGSWSVLPNFSTLTPVKTGTSPNVDISVRTAGVDDNFGFVWEGYINVPVAGTYTFETVSDDGSKLYFNSLYSPSATATVNNDGLHAATSVTGNVTVATAGYYPISITYLEKDGGQSMQVYWSGPGIPRQLIPNSAFASQLPADATPPTAPTNVAASLINSTFINLTWTASTDNVGVTGYDVYVNGTKKYSITTNSVTADGLTAGTSYNFTVKALDFAGNASTASTVFTTSTTSTTQGLTYKYYEGNWDVLPNFSALTPIKTGFTPNVDIITNRNVSDYYGFLWEGNITLPTTGTYTFETISDDGSKFYFNKSYSSTATTLVSNDGVHGPISATGTVTMAAGSYPIAITFFEKNSGESMQIYWTGPGITRQLIPNSAFAYVPPVADTTAPSAPTNVVAGTKNSTFINLSWNASTDNIGVSSYDVYVNGIKKYNTTTNSITADGLAASTSYVFTVKALDAAGNASAFSSALTSATTSVVSGLTYKYYEGNWDVLPNFSALTPVKTGTTSNIDIITARNVSDYYGFLWEGSITLPTTGTYTFETVSDDGSRLYFNKTYSATATPLIDNDGLHGANTVTGTVTANAGTYPIAITYFEKNGGESMQVYWTGPGITRQLVPNSAFVYTPPVPDTIAPGAPVNVAVTSTNGTFINLSWNASTDNVGVSGYDVYVNSVKKYSTTTNSVTADGLTNATSYVFTVKALDAAGNASAFSAPLTASTATVSISTGLNYRYYEGTWDLLPNFSALTPVKTGSSPNIDLTVRPSGKDYYYGMVWEGSISLPTAGTYTFETVSDDGSKLYFNSTYNAAANATVNNDGLHAAIPVAGTVNVPTAGSYPLAITFFQKDGGQQMQVYWTGPGISRQLIPNSAFTSAPPVPDTVAPGIPTNVAVAGTNSTFINLGWTASTDNVGVSSYDVYLNGVKKYSTTTNSVTADGLTAATSYVFTIKALDAAGNASAFSAPLSASTASVYTSTGLNYRYYEGTWDLLPNFSALTPVKTGSSPNIDLTVRPTGKDYYYGLVWEGTISIPTAGNYTFETVSDDGSKLYFNSVYSSSAVALVNNDGLHAGISATGTVNIPTAGNYPIAITFFQKDGGQQMQVYWTGPGISRQLIPNSAFTSTPPVPDVTAPTAPSNVVAATISNNFINLSWTASTDNVGVSSYDVYVNGVKKYNTATNSVTADALTSATTYLFTVKALDAAGNASAFSASLSATTSSATAGLNYRYYEGTWDLLPNFSALTPVKTGSSPNIDLTVRPTGKDYYYGLVWEGSISIPTAGSYTFETVSDDGSKLYFNSVYSSSAVATVNNDGLHAAISAAGTVNIPAAGSYPVAITFFQKDGGQQMQVYWTGPGISRQLIPNSAFTTSSASLNASVNNINIKVMKPDSVNADPQVTKMYPNPFYDRFEIGLYNPAATNNFEMVLYDFAGKPLRTEKIGTLPVGNNSIKLNWGNRHLIPGIYMVRIFVNNVPGKMFKLVKE